MNSSITRFLGGAALALAVCLSASAQEKCVGGAPGSKCGGAPAAGAPDSAGGDRVRIVFDKKDAKGEISCSKGQKKDGKIRFAKCAHKNVDKYDKVVVEKKIIASKEKYDSLAEDKKVLAKKLAFYDSARKEVSGKLAELEKAGGKDTDDYKKNEGALEKIDSEFDKALGECAKQKGELACPSK